ncbi:MAG TPA: TrbI/VirB10 family protein [Candidatus Ratteibacteria bacterium]|nr:TrbI/VirB10 family protein [Candidatus Ratteibacteria bacterium]
MTEEKEERKGKLSALKDKKTPIMLLILLFGIIFIIFTSRMGAKKITPTPTTTPEGQPTEGLLGIPSGEIYTEQIEQKQQGVLSQVEQQDKKIQDLEKQIQGMQERNNELENKIQAMGEDVAKKVEDGISKTIEDKLEEILPSKGQWAEEISPPPPPPPSLKVSSFKKTTKGKEKTIFLPAGAFVKGTLLTGVYAPGDKSNPLPVLVAVDEAFYGPKMSRVPLKGAFVIGKCIADINSARAIVQLVSFSYIYQDGKAVEKPINGYITGDDGILGINGEVIRRTGKELSGSFLSGFLSGMSEAFALKETEQSITTSGTVSTAITGSSTKYGLYSGLSQASEKISDYYAKQLEQIITAVKVEKGKKVYIVVQQGVEIESEA